MSKHQYTFAYRHPTLYAIYDFCKLVLVCVAAFSMLTVGIGVVVWCIIRAIEEPELVKRIMSVLSAIFAFSLVFAIYIVVTNR